MAQIIRIDRETARDIMSTLDELARLVVSAIDHIGTDEPVGEVVLRAQDLAEYLFSAVYGGEADGKLPAQPE